MSTSLAKLSLCLSFKGRLYIDAFCQSRKDSVADWPSYLREPSVTSSKRKTLNPAEQVFFVWLW